MPAPGAENSEDAGKNIISMREEYRMNLYEINSQIMAAFEAAVDMETGEIINEAAYELSLIHI